MIFEEKCGDTSGLGTPMLEITEKTHAPRRTLCDVRRSRERGDDELFSNTRRKRGDQTSIQLLRQGTPEYEGTGVIDKNIEIDRAGDAIDATTIVVLPYLPRHDAVRLAEDRSPP